MQFIKGIKTILIELTEEDAAEVVGLRNNSLFNKFLFQNELTVEKQMKWIKEKRIIKDNFNFKVTDLDYNFKGTISIYDIKHESGEFGRYIVKNPINAIEAELLLLNYSFKTLKLKSVYCQTNFENRTVWLQHEKFGFKNKGQKQVLVGEMPNNLVNAVIQEITATEFYNHDYTKFYELIKKFN